MIVEDVNTDTVTVELDMKFKRSAWEAMKVKIVRIVCFFRIKHRCFNLITQATISNKGIS